MFNKGDEVKLRYNGEHAVVIENLNSAIGENKYSIFTTSGKVEMYESQLERDNDLVDRKELTNDLVNSFITAKLIEKPSDESIYSFNAAKIDFIPYQFRPVMKIIQAESPRILIADGVGVGKTIEAGLIYKELQARYNAKSVLIICPKPLVAEKKWESEMRRFGEKFKAFNGATLKQTILDYDMDEVWPEEYAKCIIPFSLLDEEFLQGGLDRKNNKLGLVNLESIPKFDLIIVDEAHHIKNPNTQAYQAVKMFCDNANAVVLLTATPVQLGSNDLFVLLNLLNPNVVSSKDVFNNMSEPNLYLNKALSSIRSNTLHWQKEVYENLILAENTVFGKVSLLSNPKYLTVKNLLSKNEIDHKTRVSIINDIESFYTFYSLINRTRRRDIGTFTIRNPKTILVDFTIEQHALYKKILEIQAAILKKLHGAMCIKFMMTTIMRQSSSCLSGLVPLLEDILKRRFNELNNFNIESNYYFNPNDLNNNMEDFNIEDEVNAILRIANDLPKEDKKYDELYKIVTEKQLMLNNKMMIFSSFRHTLNYLYDNLKNSGFRVALIHGDVADYERVNLRERFKLSKENGSALDILLFSEVGCEGLDYQFCDCIVNYDLPWNPMRIEQRIGRIDRKGQKSEKVAIVNILTNDTIDYDIYNKCLMRIGVFNESIGDSEEILGEVSREISNIANSYVLDDRDKKEKLQQLGDNTIRLSIENEKLETEQSKLFGLDISNNAINDQINEAINLHLSPEALERMINSYFDNAFGGHAMFMGDLNSKTIRLSKENKEKLLLDYKNIDKQKNDTYKNWFNYLHGETQCFYASLNNIVDDGSSKNAEIISITHPLIRQAATVLKNIKIPYCKILIENSELPKGKYPFALYQWNYKGLKEESAILPMSTLKVNEKRLMELVFKADKIETVEDEGDIYKILDEIHYKKWTTTKSEYKETIISSVKAKLQSLEFNYANRIANIRGTIDSLNNDKIIKMKRKELENVATEFENKKNQYNAIFDKIDLLTELIFKGIIEII